MADVYTVLFTLIGILITLPALLVAINLLLPQLSRRAETRLKETPGRSFLMGVPVTIIFLVIILIATQVNVGPVQAFGFLVAVIGMGLGTLGAAGMTRLLSERLAPISQPYSELRNLLRGALVYELACLFPLVGWFLFIPIAGITVLGAAVFALLGWLPRPVAREQVVVAQNS